MKVEYIKLYNFWLAVSSLENNYNWFQSNIYGQTRPILLNDFEAALLSKPLNRIWCNFKRRFLGTSRTDSNSHSDICPGSICPYQEYLNFEETLKVASWEHLEQTPNVRVTFDQATFVLATFVHIRISCYWPNFDKALKVASWEHLEQIPTIKLTFV